MVHSCEPRSISSVAIFIEEFLQHRGPKFKSFEDTYQDLLAALREGEDLLGFFESNEEIDDDEAFLEEEDSHEDGSAEIIKDSEDLYVDASGSDDDSAPKESFCPDFKEVDYAGHARGSMDITDKHKETPLTLLRSLVALKRELRSQKNKAAATLGRI
jgi:hypothetical protein